MANLKDIAENIKKNNLDEALNLCDDCDKNGTFCEPLLTQKKNTKSKQSIFYKSITD